MMGVNPEAARELLRYGLPIVLLWFNIGFGIAVLYHLSLIFVDKEFRRRDTLVLDVFVSALRFLLYILAWPAVLFFDRSALVRIRVFFDWLRPAARKESVEVEEARGEAELADWVERKRCAEVVREAALGRLPLECERRKVELHEGSPRLDKFWLMAAVGRGSDGASRIVRLYGPDLTVDEVAARARTEVGLRHERLCPKCEERLAVARVRVPDLRFLRVKDANEELVVEGWALEGRYSVDWEQCDDCAGQSPMLEGDVTQMGRVADIIRALRSGLVFHEDVCGAPDDPHRAAAREADGGRPG